MAVFLDEASNNYYYYSPETESVPFKSGSAAAASSVASSLDDSQLLPPDAFQPTTGRAHASFSAASSSGYFPPPLPASFLTSLTPNQQQQQPQPANCRSCRQMERDLARLRRDLDRFRKQQQQKPDFLTDWDESRESLATRAAELEAANERLRADADLRERRLELQSELLAEPVGGDSAAAAEAAAWRPRLYKALVQAEAERWAHERELRQLAAEAESTAAGLRRRCEEAEARAEAAERKLAAADKLVDRLQSDARRSTERRAKEINDASQAADSARTAFELAAGQWLEKLADMDGRLSRLAETTDLLAASEKLAQLSSVSDLRAALDETRSALDNERQARRLEAGRQADALAAAEREQAKLAAALSHSERRLQREREAAEARSRQATEDFQLATERLRDRLRLVEGERNLLQAAASATEHQNRLAVQRPHSSASMLLAAAGGGGPTEDAKLRDAVRDLRQMLANSG